MAPANNRPTRVEQRFFLDHWYFTGMAIVMIAISVAGFLPAIAHPATRRAPLTFLAAAHGIVFFAWLLLFLAQSLLVAMRRTAWHRRLGPASIVLLAIMIPLGFMTTTAMLRRGFDLSGDQGIDPHPAPGSNMVDAATGSEFNFFTLLLFSLLVLTALVFRRRPELHKRLMVFANIVLVTAPLSHLAGHFPQLPGWFGAAVGISLLVSVVVRDFVVTKRINASSVVLAICLYACVPFQVYVIIPSETWHRFVIWASQ
jgi:hypothetical protein